MQINPYLNFNGTCEEAFGFYAKLLGGQVESISRFGDSPDAETHPTMRDKVMHARLVVGGQVLMGSDAPEGYYSKPQGNYVSINVDKPADARRIFDGLAAGGDVHMPFEKTFWAAGGFGMVADRFGTPWMVNCEKGE